MPGIRFGVLGYVEATGGQEFILPESWLDRLRCYVLVNQVPNDALKEAIDDLENLVIWNVSARVTPSLPAIARWIEPSGLERLPPPPLELPEE